MLMTRRRFLELGGAFAASAVFARSSIAQERFITAQGPWRKFDLTARLAFLKPNGKAQAWIPVPSVNESDWSKALGSDWKTNAKIARLEKNAGYATDLVYLEWDDTQLEAFAEISSHAETRDRLTDFIRPLKPSVLADDLKSRFTQLPSDLPDQPHLYEVASEITENAKTDLGKAKAIYEWVVEERSCERPKFGALKVHPSAEPDLLSDCKNLNKLFVALSRISGVPARQIIGVRVAPSQYGYESLGAVPENITAKIHARAEVWLADYGWVPADPDDVHRVIRDEPPGALDLADPKVIAARTTLFGAWEGNWIAYNMGTNILLPQSDGITTPYLFQPIVQLAAQVIDASQADGFSFKLTAKELPA